MNNKAEVLKSLQVLIDHKRFVEVPKWVRDPRIQTMIMGDVENLQNIQTEIINNKREEAFRLLKKLDTAVRDSVDEFVWDYCKTLAEGPAEAPKQKGWLVYLISLARYEYDEDYGYPSDFRMCLTAAAVKKAKAELHAKAFYQDVVVEEKELES